MRVSTSQIFDTGTLGIQNNQSGLYRLQNQLSTGRRVLTPADDPVASAQALIVTQAQAVNKQFIENQKTANAQLAFTDNTLSGVNDELSSILDRAIQAGNGTLGVNERNMIATELQSRLENLVSLANTQDGTGQYLFAGFQSQVKPFVESGNAGVGVPPAFDLANSYISYLGDDGQQKLQVDSSQDMAVNEVGSEVFMRIRDASGNLTGRSVFDSVKNLVTNLQQPSANFQASYDQSLSDLRSALDSVSTTRSRIGAKQNALEGMTNVGMDTNLQYGARLSDLQDLDYAKAISDMMQQKMQLEAAQLSFAITSKLTLFNSI